MYLLVRVGREMISSLNDAHFNLFIIGDIQQRSALSYLSYFFSICCITHTLCGIPDFIHISVKKENIYLHSCPVI